MVAQVASVLPHGSKMSYLPKTTGASRDNQATIKWFEEYTSCFAAAKIKSISLHSIDLL
jgi:hypothetical protein